MLISKLVSFYLLIIGVIICCGNICCNNIEEKDTKQAEDADQILKYLSGLTGPHPKLYDPIDKYMRRSDFCIVGKIHVDKMIDDKPYMRRKVIGTIEVISIIYGDPKTKEIPFQAVERRQDSDRGEGLSFDSLVTNYFWLLEKENVVELILLGKGTGKNITLICPIDLDDLQYVKTIKSLEDMDKKAFLKQRAKLLADSNDTRLLAYLFRRSFKEEKIDGAMSTIRGLINEGKATKERYYLAYDLAADVLRDYPKSMAIQRYFEKYYAKPLDESQRKELAEIIIKEWKNIKTIDEGFDHMWSLNAQMLAENAELKEGLKKIVLTLSEQFKGNERYPAWSEWVKKIFPDETPKPNEDK